jgi:hypothetical protein
MFSISWKCKSFFGVFACFYNRSLIFVLCFCYLFLEGIFCPHVVYSILLSVGCKYKIAIFMFLVSAFSLHHCIWDCHPVLSLTAFWVFVDFWCGACQCWAKTLKLLPFKSFLRWPIKVSNTGFKTQTTTNAIVKPLDHMLFLLLCPPKKLYTHLN